MVDLVVSILSLAALGATLAVSIVWFRDASPGRRLAIAVFPVTQAALAATLLVVVIRAGLSAAIVVQVAVVCLACAAADFALFAAIRVLRQRELDKRKAISFEEQLRDEEEYRVQLEEEAASARALRNRLLEQLAALEKELEFEDREQVENSIARTAEVLKPPAGKRCSNHAVDALMRAKANACKRAGIKLQTRLDVRQGIPFPAVDVCALFANIMDNAIRASAACEPERRAVSIHAGEASGLFVIDAENSCMPGSRAETHGKKRLSISQKHGWGIEIVNDVAHRFNGTVESCSKEGTFRITVALELPQGGGNCLFHDSNRSR